MRKSWTLRLSAAAVAVLLVLGACGDGAGDDAVDSEETTPTAEETTPTAAESDAAEPEELVVVATTTILGDLVKGIVGDDATVTVLLPVGADPHDYQPSSRDGVTIREADLVVANGLMLEESLVAVLDSARDDGARILEVGDMLDPMEWGAGRDPHEGEEDDHGHDHDEEAHDDEMAHEEDDHGHDHDEEAHDDEMAHEEDDHGHAHGAFDPHFWFDPARVQRAVELIAAELADIGKVLSPAEWTERGRVFAAEIGEAADEAQEILAAVPESQRKLVTNHDSFAYFGVYFDFEVLDSVLPGSGLAQADTARLARIVEQIEEEGVTTLFTETIADAAVVQTVANEFDPPLALVELYTGSLGPEGSDADTYIKWLLENSRRIAEALTP